MYTNIIGFSYLGILEYHFIGTSCAKALYSLTIFGMAQNIDSVGTQTVKFRNETVKIPTCNLRGTEYLFLENVQQEFPPVKTLRIGNEQLPFIRDEDGMQLTPLRVKARIGEVIEAREPVGPPNYNYDDQFALIHEDMRQLQHTSNLIFDNTQEMLRQIGQVMIQMYELHEYTTPRYFFILPAKHYETTLINNVRNLLQLHYKLYFLCECSHNPKRMHIAPHEGYSIKKTQDFILRYGPYLRTTLNIVQVLLSVGGIVVPAIGSVAPVVGNALPSSLEPENFENLKQQLQLVNNLISIHDDNEEDADSSYFEPNEPKRAPLQGPDLRELETYLELSDNKRSLGNLYRTITDDGHVRWLCLEHYHKNKWKNKMSEYIKELEAMGGKFDEEKREAIVSRVNLNDKNVKMLCEALTKGFSIVKLIFRDCSFSEDDLDKLLDVVINRSSIHYLSMTDIRTRNFLGLIKYNCHWMDTEFNNHLMKVRFYDSNRDANILMLTRLLLQNKIRRKLDFSACDIVGHESDLRKCLESTGIVTSLTMEYSNNINLLKALYKLKPDALNELKLYNSVLEHSTLSLLCEILKKNTTLVVIDLMDRTKFEDENFVPNLLNTLRGHKSIKYLHLYIENIRPSNSKETCLIDSLRNDKFISRLCISKSIISRELTDAFVYASKERRTLIHLEFYTSQVQDHDVERLHSLYDSGSLIQIIFSDQPRWLAMLEQTNIQPRRGKKCNMLNLTIASENDLQKRIGKKVTFRMSSIQIASRYLYAATRCRLKENTII